MLRFGLIALLAFAGCPARGDHADVANGVSTKPPEAAHDTDGATRARVVLMPPGRDPVTVPVELAVTEAERRKGMMFRTQLGADAGMLFLFEQPDHLSFWMRNTYIPLDMIFIEPSTEGAAAALRGDATMAILGIVENAEPRTDTSRSVPGLSQYVLEVNAGFSRAHGLAQGTLVRFEGVDAATQGR